RLIVFGGNEELSFNLNHGSLYLLPRRRITSEVIRSSFHELSASHNMARAILSGSIDRNRSSGPTNTRLNTLMICLASHSPGLRSFRLPAIRDGLNIWMRGIPCYRTPSSICPLVRL